MGPLVAPPARPAHDDDLTERLLDPRAVAVGGDGNLGDLFTTTSATFARAPSVDDGFDEGARTIVTSLAKHKAVIRLIMTEAAASPALRHTLAGAYTALAGLTSSYLAKLSARGKARVEDPETAGWAMFGTIYVQVMRWALFDQLDDAQLGEQLQITARLLLATIGRDR